MATARAQRRAGFTLPLTLALAFSLMALATAIVGMVVVSDKEAKAAASAFVTRASLESGIETALADLEDNGEPQAAEWAGHEVFNGQDVELVVASARYKPDVNHAPADDVAAVIADPALRDRAVAAVAAPAPDQQRPAYGRFKDFTEATGASAIEEDCLRRRLTIGREAGKAPLPPPMGALTPPRTPLAAGEVIDVRAMTRDWEGREEALWRRVRFTGRPARPWLTHDWRELRLGRTAPDCPLVEAAPTIPTGPHHRLR